MICFVDDMSKLTRTSTSTISLLASTWSTAHDREAAQRAEHAGCCVPEPDCRSFIVNPRLQRLFTTFNIGMPDTTSLLTIYQTFLEGHFNTLAWNSAYHDITVNLIKGALALHSAVSANFRKTAKNFHYEFNIRHISNVFQGCLPRARKVP